MTNNIITCFQSQIPLLIFAMLVGLLLLFFQYSVGASDLTWTLNHCGDLAADSSITIRNIGGYEDEYKGSIAYKSSVVVLYPLVEVVSFGRQMARLQFHDPEQIAAEALFQVIVDELKIQKKKIGKIKDSSERELRTACLVKCFVSNWMKYDDELVKKVYDWDPAAIYTKIKNDFIYRPSNILLNRHGLCTQYSIAASKLLLRLGVVAPVAIGGVHAFNTLKTRPLYFEPQNEYCEFFRHEKH